MSLPHPRRKERGTGFAPGHAVPLAATGFHWLKTGGEALAEMLQAIAHAKESVRLEMYIIQPGVHGEKFRHALAAAARRGVRVRVLADGFGSLYLPPDFREQLIAAGGEFRYFSVPGGFRYALRDHRKVLVCDDQVAFIGGLNIGPEYAGDGVKTGWRDLGLRFNGTLAGALGRAFDEMFELAQFRLTRFAWVRHAIRQHRLGTETATLLLSAPGWRRNPMVRSLVGDFNTATAIQIISAYFLPKGRILRALRRAAQRGARVQIVLGAQSDMWIMQMAARCLYRRLLTAGVEIYEYQPQVLHAKLIIINHQVTYAGSANLDVRSLHLNYESLMRVENQRLAHEAHEIFDGDLTHCKRIELGAWLKTRHWWRRVLDNMAYFMVAHFDPFISSFSWRR